MPLTKTAIEPVLPEQRSAALEDLACSVIEKAARLEARVRPEFQRELARITRWMHCYYSNFIEGQQTFPREIEAALRKDFSGEPAKKNLQKLALAHLSVQEWASAYAESPYAPVFIRELHRRFYAELPGEMRIVRSRSGGKTALDIGKFRNRDIEVGSHVGPPHELVPALMEHFHAHYENPVLSRVGRIIAVAASHHRFAWIHPFRDGNGRVVRLLSDTLIRQLGIDSGGLWSLSRGLAVRKEEYYARLSNADQERSGGSAADGRGHLSERALREFCEFVLRTMLDQIEFMDRMLELDGLADRMERYVKVEEPFGKQDAEKVFLLLREALYRGAFSRGDAARVVGTSERTGRHILSRALDAGLLQSEHHKDAVRLALPAKVLATYFPRLFPLSN